MGRIVLAAAALLVSAAATQPAAMAQDSLPATARLTGTVRDMQGAPIRHARAHLDITGPGAVTDDSGRFTLESLPAGTATLTVRALGYSPARLSVRLTADSTSAVEIQFATPRLAPVTVRARRFDRNMEDFERRRRQGFGHFFDPGELARRAPNRLPLVLAVVPNTVLTCPPGGECYIRFNRPGGPAGSGIGTSNTCSPAIYIDGRLDLTGEAWSLWSDQVAAVEVYTRESTRPFEFTQLNNRCGAIALWRNPPELDPRESADVIAAAQCGGRLSWCYLRQWWPLAALVAVGFVTLR